MSRLLKPQVEFGQVGTFNGVSIPTFYRAQTFRSRLEARWAVFMDVLGVEWFYEYEGFDLKSGRYLPDFWLPDLKKWLEIKPPGFEPFGKDADSRDMKRCREFQLAHPLVIFVGSPAEQDNARDWDWYGNEGGYVAGDSHHLWCRCPKCGAVGIEFDGRGARVCGSRCMPDDDKAYTFDDREILVATAHSMTWRFQ
jgi:hypothetical protein